ncbi:MAG: ATP-binding protein [bacterium]
MSGARILVVEDEGIIASDIKSTLEKIGYRVEAVVAYGEEAVYLAEKHRPDMVLMDIVLKKDMDGIEAARQIYFRYNIPVIYLTAYADERILERAAATEPFGYIIKPFQEDELRTSIEVALYRHKIEKKLKQSESLFSTVLKSIGDAIITTDPRGMVTFMNPVAESLTGWGRKDAFGKNIGDIFNFNNEKIRSRLAIPMAQAFTEGTSASLDGFLLPSLNGHELAININTFPIRDDSGTITGAVIVFHDVTKRRKTEEKMKRAMAELICSKAEMEQFSYIVSHDLQEPLKQVAILASLLKRHFGEGSDPNVARGIVSIISEVSKMQEMLDDLLAFSLVISQGSEVALVDFNDILARTLDTMREEIARVQAEITCDRLPSVMADGLQMIQLFSNLIENAIEFRRESPPRIHISAKAGDGGWIFSVEDNGIGIKSEFFDFIFLIFQRLHGKKEHPGSGVGLAICKKIVENHGGRIWVESQPGRGSTFFFTLPEAAPQ